MSNPRSTQFVSGAAFLLFSTLFINGCGEDQVEQAAETENSPQMIQREAPNRSPRSERAETVAEDSATDFRVVPNLEGRLEKDGLGLETIIDASSKKAYADSLAWIAEDVSAEQYKQLERSLRYIQVYDSSVLGNEQRFLQLIDGKTGQELIDRANKLIQQRRG